MIPILVIAVGLAERVVLRNMGPAPAGAMGSASLP